ncbi:uncharacterized protein LOC144709568 [Wolffia australiana]
MGMATKHLLFFLVSFVALVGIWADSGIANGVADVEILEDPAALKLDLEQMKSKISVLESSLAEEEKQLKARDESISLLEKIIKEKTETVASLQEHIESLQKKGAADTAQLLGKAHARAAEFEKQVEDLKGDILVKNQKQNALEARAVEAERKVEELKSNVENLRSANEDQKKRIKKTERALKVAEEELMKVRLEVSLRKKELNKIQGAWLPPWLADRLIHYQAAAATHWTKHGKPAYDTVVLKILEISSAAHEKLDPHLQTAKTKWIPIIKERREAISSSVEPLLRSTLARAVDLYEASLKPHILKAQEAADPYFQDAKKLSKPYIDRAAEIARPRVEKVRVVLKPYTKKYGRSYRRFLKTAKAYHLQIQASAKDVLRSHELTRALATDELVWFAASAALALPVFVTVQLLASVFRRKPRGRAQSSQAHRRPKRRHADK